MLKDLYSDEYKDVARAIKLSQNIYFKCLYQQKITEILLLLKKYRETMVPKTDYTLALALGLGCTACAIS